MTRNIYYIDKVEKYTDKACLVRFTNVDQKDGIPRTEWLPLKMATPLRVKWTSPVTGVPGNYRQTIEVEIETPGPTMGKRVVMELFNSIAQIVEGAPLLYISPWFKQNLMDKSIMIRLSVFEWGRCDKLEVDRASDPGDSDLPF